MLPLNKTLLIFFLATCCLLALLPATSTSATSVGISNKNEVLTRFAPPPYECSSMDIRNHCSNFEHLNNCTVITGYLIIVLLPSNETCDYSKYRFPKLREITDFLLIYDVKNLTTLEYMFPNLTVIRGSQLFLNYALGVTQMNELATLEFPSLVAIQRGKVLIGSNPKLCYLEQINFDRLTVMPGENHIYPAKNVDCSRVPQPVGCASESYWSNMVCQKFENDNIIHYKKGIAHCHDQCLGGCYNTTAQGCAVCRSWTDHGQCVSKCPKDKYPSQHYLRCYTREECIAKKLVIYKQTCVAKCPSGYRLNNITQECDSCGGVNSCITVCNSTSALEPIYINTLADMERIKGCHICNGSVFINLRNPIKEQELEDSLSEIREIVGHLKVYKNSYLTSLSFFRNLQKIHGTPLENQHYSLVLYNNQNLTELWPLKDGALELVHGGIYIHANDRLCNSVIQKFRNAIRHDNSLDSLQTSDQEVLCSPAKLNLDIEVLSHRSIRFAWAKYQTSEEVEIIYRPVEPGKTFSIHSELETSVCERGHWQRQLTFPNELQRNDTHYFYTVDKLEPHTRYACLVKTFGDNVEHQARSELKYATTNSDVPQAPLLEISNKTNASISVRLYYKNREDELVDYYVLDVFEIYENETITDQRDYCEDPMKPYPDYHNEDFDDCCNRRLEEAEDDVFRQQLQKEFGCSLDHKENCVEENPKARCSSNNTKSWHTKCLEHYESNYTITGMKQFHLYTVHVKACNRAGCGPINIITGRTNYSTKSDNVNDLMACKMSHNNEYRVHFSQPQNSNGHIISYALHFRYLDVSTAGPFLSHMHCLTRLEHARNNFLYVGYLNSTYNQVKVRVESFGHRNYTAWVNITTCSHSPPLTKLAGRGSSGGWNIFFIFFTLGAGGTALWVCYKRRYWRKLPKFRTCLPLYTSWRALRPDADNEEDRQILVDGFETVRFHNSPEDDKKYLVH
ncbi:insulin-like peptide receptor [Stomoxys calcitrans]|uniref:insulin-like peptide receptor n=1 Tax=Stomoxys calcitrans TaxID=35570 RepID=UPI0027E276EA|nr:insulin-like peptide receptor [Stomoxys calcitrans]